MAASRAITQSERSFFFRGAVDGTKEKAAWASGRRVVTQEGRKVIRKLSSSSLPERPISRCPSMDGLCRSTDRWIRRSYPSASDMPRWRGPYKKKATARSAWLNARGSKVCCSLLLKRQARGRLRLQRPALRES
jgi:hypothetical protein